ncbi:MAG TPA: HupE/UreJ family protein [Burkholderiales bacterium]|nr:HupE/UreJ family protein [Burkholderiales bacterium]
MIRASLIVMIATLACCARVTASLAHPLGNNTTNRQATIHLATTGITLDYLVDAAEIPTLLHSQEADANADGTTTAAEWDAYAKRWARKTARTLELRLDGAAVMLALERAHWQLLAGAADLFTLRLDARYRAASPSKWSDLTYSDPDRPNDPGWKEVWIDAGPGVMLLQTSTATVDRSARLTQFPSNGELLNELSGRAEVAFTPVPAPARVKQADETRSGRTASADTSHKQADARFKSDRLEPGLTDRFKPSTGPGHRLERGHTDRFKPSTAPEQSDVRSAPFPASRTESAGVESAPAAPAQANGPTAVVPTGSTAQREDVSWTRAASFFRLGVHHIATGWDHLVFLLGLLLFRHTPIQLAKVVTAFTLAHSFTLALAANGWVSPPSLLIEPAIALTIAYVGLMNLLHRDMRDGAWLAFGFGLVHGFGFAGALSQTMAEGERASSSHSWLLDLASFNLGIEAFQLLLVAAAVPLFAWISRFSWSGSLRALASLGVLSAGVGWFVARVA